MEDFASGIGTVTQSRGGQSLTLTKVSAAVFPYSDTQTVAQKINDLDAKYDYVIANTSTSFSISTLIRKSGEDLIDVNGDVFTPQVIETAGSAEASYPAKLWVKIISSTEHHLKRGADLIAMFNPITHVQLFDYATIATAVAALFGTAASEDVGTSAGNVVQLDGDAKLPAVDGSQLTNLTIPVVVGIPIGGGCLHFSTVVPTGFLECNGVAISRTTYAALFAVIGTTFGPGDGLTTFQLPDCRGEFIRGWDNGRGVDPARTFGSAQGDMLKSHKHNYYSIENASSTGAAANRVFNLQPDNPWANDTNKFDTTNTGGSETRPRNIAAMYIIRYQ